MKNTLTSFLFICLMASYMCPNTKAQEAKKSWRHQIDSLKTRIQSANTATEEEQCAVAKDFIYLAAYFDRSQQLDSSLKWLSVGELLQLKNCKFYLEIKLYKGDMQRRLGHVDSALNTFQSALPYVLSESDKAKIHFNIGTSQIVSRLLDEALISMHKARRLAYNANDTSLLINIYNNTGTIFRSLSRTDSALICFRKGNELNRGKYLNPRSKYVATLEMASAYYQQNKLDSAQRFFWKVNGSFESDPPAAVSVYSKMGIIKYHLNDLDSSHYFLSKSLEINNNYPELEILPNVLNYLAALELLNHNNIKSQRLLKTSDSLFEFKLNVANKEAVAEANAKFEVTKNQLEKQVAQRKVESHQKTLIFSLVFVAFVIAIAIVLFRQRKRLAKVNHSLKVILKEKDHFMSMLTHDLRSPISSIAGNSELLYDNTEWSDQHGNVLKDIHSAAVSSLNMMNEVLDMFRFESDDNLITLEYVELKSICEHMYRRYLPLATAKKQSLELNCHNNLNLYANPTLLKSIIGNLLSNAIKFNREGGICTIGAIQTDQKIVLEVRDDGPGFTENDHKEAFSKFRQGEQRPTAGEGTSGLGLYMVKVMVEKLGGTIELHTTKGKGAKFIMQFPADSAEIK